MRFAYLALVSLLFATSSSSTPPNAWRMTPVKTSNIRAQKDCYLSELKPSMPCYIIRQDIKHNGEEPGIKTALFNPFINNPFKGKVQTYAVIYEYESDCRCAEQDSVMVTRYPAHEKSQSFLFDIVSSDHIAVWAITRDGGKTFSKMYIESKAGVS